MFRYVPFQSELIADSIVSRCSLGVVLDPELFEALALDRFHIERSTTGVDLTPMAVLSPSLIVATFPLHRSIMLSLSYR